MTMPTRAGGIQNSTLIMKFELFHKFSFSSHLKLGLVLAKKKKKYSGMSCKRGTHRTKFRYRQISSDFSLA